MSDEWRETLGDALRWSAPFYLGAVVARVLGPVTEADFLLFGTAVIVGFVVGGILKYARGGRGET